MGTKQLTRAEPMVVCSKCEADVQLVVSIEHWPHGSRGHWLDTMLVTLVPGITSYPNNKFLVAVSDSPGAYTKQPHDEVFYKKLMAAMKDGELVRILKSNAATAVDHEYIFHPGNRDAAHPVLVFRQPIVVQ